MPPTRPGKAATFPRNPALAQFCHQTAVRYAPVEGEDLIIVRSLEQTKYFTQGCNNLVVVSDHKSFLELFGDQVLDEIANPCLFRLKSITLMRHFTTQHSPGNNNLFSDATLQNPVVSEDDDKLTNVTTFIDFIHTTTIMTMIRQMICPWSPRIEKMTLELLLGRLSNKLKPVVVIPRILFIAWDRVFPQANLSCQLTFLGFGINVSNSISLLREWRPRR